MRTRVCVLVATVVATLAGACGGKTAGGGGAGGGGSSETGSSTTSSNISSSNIISSSNSSSNISSEMAGACVEFEPTPAELQCSSDSDCVSLNTGKICPGDCFCGGSPGNQSAQSRLSAETTGFPDEGCPCPDFGQPRCFGGQCILCGFEQDAGAGCSDGGFVPPFEDGGSDAG